MNQYYELLRKSKKVNNDIKLEKKKLHNEFAKINSKWLRVLDIIVIVTILFNFGAVFLTNAMVMRENAVKVESGEAEPLVFYEANEAQRNLNDYVAPPNPETEERLQNLMKAILIQALLWAAILFFYIYYRRNVFTEEALVSMTLVVSVWFVMLTWDFWSDFGYFIGRLVFGG